MLQNIARYSDEILRVPALDRDRFAAYFLGALLQQVNETVYLQAMATAKSLVQPLQNSRWQARKD